MSGVAVNLRMELFDTECIQCRLKHRPAYCRASEQKGIGFFEKRHAGRQGLLGIRGSATLPALRFSMKGSGWNPERREQVDPMEALKKRKGSNTDVFRELLLAKRDELQKRIEQRREEIVLQREPDDEGAQALHSVTNDLAMANMEREVRTLAEIELSLRRIEAGEYGICGSCEERIPEARLRALPWTRLCVECAGGGVGRREERHERPFLVRPSGELDPHDGD